MRINITTDHNLNENGHALIVSLFTRDEKDYLAGSEEGIYNCAVPLPKDPTEMMGLIEMCVNACFKKYDTAVDEYLAGLKEF